MRLSRLIPGLAAAVGTAFVLVRLPTATASLPGGAGGGNLAPHIGRLELALDTGRLLHGELGPLDWLRRLDGDFPPLVTFVHWLLAAPLGQDLSVACFVGWLWVLLLALGVGGVARELAPPEQAERAGAAAATGVLLLAPLQAFAVRTWYDLPMLALLFAGLALLLRARDLRGGAVAGGVALLACLAKWTALPLLAICGVGVLLHTRRWRPVLGAVAALGAGLLLWFTAIPTGGDPGSYAAMTGTFDPNPQTEPVPAWLASVLPATLERALGRTNWLNQHTGTLWRAFHLRWLVWSMLSPLVTLLLVPLWLRWLAGGLRGGAVVLTTFFGHWLFLLLLVPVADERFFLSGALAAMVAAALGWAALGARARWVAGAAVGLALLAVGAEFHLGDDGPHPEIDGPLATLSEPGTWRLRSASQPDLAWARGDEPIEWAPTLQRSLWDEVVRCDARVIGLSEDRDGGLVPVIGSWRWWTLRFLEEAVRTGADRRQTVDVRAEDGVPEGSPPVDLYVVPWDPPAPPSGPVFLGADGLALQAQFAPQPREWERGAAVWRPEGRDCP